MNLLIPTEVSHKSGASAPLTEQPMTNRFSSPRSLRSLRSICGLTILAAAVFTAHAQDLTIKSPPQAQPIAIFNATIHTMAGDDIPDGAIVFDKGRITQVLDEGAWDRTPEATRRAWKQVDAHGGHVYPGLVGAYTQIGLTEFGAVRATIDSDESSNPITPEVKAVTAVNPDSTLIPVTRSNGVMTVAVFPLGGIISGQVGAIRLEGWTTDELIINPSIGMGIRWPSTRTITAWWMDRSEEDQRRDIGQNLKVITDAFDATEAYVRARATDESAPVDLRWEAMKTVLPADAQARTFILANDVDQITSAVAFAVSRKLKCVIVGGRDAALCADLLKRHDIPVIVQGTLRMPRHDDSPYDEAYTLPARLHEAGVKFCIATSDDTAHERNLPYNAAMAAAHGLPMDAAQKAVTLWPAQILGIDNEVGSLEVGKAAVLLITTGNPLEVTTHIEKAFVDGRDIDLTNKQTKLADKYRERYRQLGLLKIESQGEGKK